MDRQRSTRLVAAGAAAAVSMGTLALVQAPAAQAAGLCQTDCIGTVTAAAGLDQVRLTFTTTTTTKVSVTFQRADNSGAATVWGGQAAALATSYDIPVTALALGTQYRYKIVATDTQGSSWQEVGYFATSQRRITVTPSKLTVDDDSDSFSAGDVVGAAHLYDGCIGDIRALAPLSLTSLSQVSGGSTLTVQSSASITCDKVPASVRFETQLADNDVDSGDSCGAWWPWRFTATSWGAMYGSNTCADWNNGSSIFTFPLAASLPTGSTSVAFTHKSTQKSWDGFPLALRWTLTGTVTYSHVKPAGTLPATTTGAVSTQASATSADASVQVSWVAVSAPGFTTYGYRVSRRPVGGSWTSTDVSAATLSTALTGLTNGTTYEITVAALDYAKKPFALSTTSGAPVASVKATSVTGWTTSATSQAPGTALTVPVTVSTDGAPRGVSLQARTQGAVDWTTYWTGSTDASGQVSLPLPVSQGVREHRLVVPATGSFAGQVTATRTITALTTITGFDTTPVTAPSGTEVTATATVTPGAGREVVVLRRSPGGTWTFVQTVVADAEGLVTYAIPVEQGTSEWAFRAQADVAFGSEATSDARSVTSSGAATTVSGWTTASATLPVGTLVSTPVTVTTTDTARTLRLQYQLPGSSTWVTQLTLQAELSGAATVAYKVKPGRVAWRLVVDPTVDHAGVVTAKRTITAKSSISGFATTSVTTARGTVISDGITVKPGAGRSVLVQYRAYGTTTWKTYRTVVASSTGSVTVKLTAFAGRYVWRAYVAANPTYGSAAASGLRTVTGR